MKDCPAFTLETYIETYTYFPSFVSKQPPPLYPYFHSKYPIQKPVKEMNLKQCLLSPCFPPFNKTFSLCKDHCLGLSIAQLIAVQHNGSISVSYEHGEATFQVVLPVKA